MRRKLNSLRYQIRPPSTVCVLRLMSESNQALTRYLLGELSEAECSALEQRYFTDPALFDQIVEVENELADDYARGRLDVQTRQRFETHYLNHPQRRERA